MRKKVIGFVQSTMLFALGILGALVYAFSFPAEAQQVRKIPRVGFLSNVSVPARMESFRQGLRELGYIDGQNIVVEYRFSDGKRDRLSGLAADLIRLNVDVIVAGGGSSTEAAKNATKAIPIVMMNVTDPIAAGFVASLARPGGNITGLTTLAPELGGKRLELLKETVPQVSRVAVLGNRGSQSRPLQLKEVEAAAKALGLQLVSYSEVGVPKDLESAFSEMAKKRAGALIVLQGPIIGFHRHKVVELAAKKRLPAVYFDTEFVEAGGLMSYSPSFPDLYRRAATYVDKILRGTKPADLPVEQPMKFEFVINLKAAKQIGVTIPPNVLARADRVIR